MSTDTQTTDSTQDTAPSEDVSQIAPDTAPSDSGQTDAADDSGAGSQPETSPQDAPTDTDTQPTVDNSKSVASTAPSQPEVIDPESYKRLRDEKSTWGRQTAEIRRQYEETRTQLAKLQQEREQSRQMAEQQKLALHDYRHPDHAAKFQPILAKADIVRSQLAKVNSAQLPPGLAPEHEQAWRESQKQAILSTLSDEEHNALEQFQNHNQNFQRKLALNPAQALTEFVQPMLEQFFQRKTMDQQAASEVDRDFADPELGPVLTEFKPQMAEMIQKLGGTDEAYDFAKHHALVYAQNQKLSQEIARLKQQNGEANIKVGAAATQQELAKGKASITRDVTPRQTRSAYDIASERAKKQGIDRSSPPFFQLVREIEAEQAAR